MYKLLLLLLALSLSISINAQQEDYKIPDLLKSVKPYGTFEYAIAANEASISIVDIVPRIGLTGKWFIDESEEISFFTTAELGITLSKKRDFFSISADQGAGIHAPELPLYARLGFIGMETKYGKISFGKQWGVHYSIVGFLDNMYMFGAEAIGVYNAKSDGGASGTGRADQLLKYEHEIGNLYIGFQSQHRNISENDKYLADGIGAALKYDFGRLSIGTSYTQVFDGVPTPFYGQAADSDYYASIAATYYNDRNLWFGVAISKFKNHEIDDINQYYSGFAAEYHLKYAFGKDKKWRFVNNTMINASTDSGSFYANKYSFELARRFSENTALIIGFRLDNSGYLDVNTASEGAIALGFYYNFNYPVP